MVIKGWHFFKTHTVDLSLHEQDVEVLLKALMSSPKSEHELTEGLLIRKLQSCLAEVHYLNSTV